jgi:hypothetical protein
MTQTDWAKIYAAMDKRIELKYDQLARGEQIGKTQKTSTTQAVNLRGNPVSRPA